MLASFLRCLVLSTLVLVTFIACHSAHADGVVSLNVVSRSGQAQSNVPVTFAQVFKKGDVGGQQPLIAVVDGNRVPLQVNRKASNADGSLRHAVLTALLPSLPAHGAETVTLALGSSATPDPAVSLDDLLATHFDASLALDVDGTTYIADARRMLENAKAVNACRPWGKTCNVWLSGPLAGDWIVTGALRTAGGASHPDLSACFDVRYYPRSGQVRVSVMVDNDWTYTGSPHDIRYDAQILVDGQTVYTTKNLVHSAHARWRKVFWSSAEPALYVNPDLAYLKSTGAIPNYDASLKIPEKVISAFYSRFEKSGRAPMHSSIVTNNMFITGGRGDIGPLPQWTALRLISMDPRLIEADDTINDLSGSWPIHYRDRATGRPVSLQDHPNITIHTNLRRNPGWVSTGGANPYGLKPDWNHEPDFGFVPYLLTGDYYYLEELQFWASWNPLTTSPAYRGYAKGLYDWTQIRGQAWALRTLGQTAYLTPDNDPMKDYWQRQIKNNIQWYDSQYANNLQANKLGFIIHQTPGYFNGVGGAPWQDDFFTWAMGYLVNLGFIDAQPMLAYKARSPVGRMTASGYCYVEASIYVLKLRNSRTSPVYDTFAEAYRNSVGQKLFKARCAGQAMANLIGKHPGQYKPGDLAGYPWGAEGFPSNLQPALAAAVDSGIANADKAWQIFADRPTKPDYSDEPNWDIVPRPQSTGSIPPPTISLIVSPDYVESEGTATIEWTASNAISCEAPWTDETAPSGQQQVGPLTQTSAFTLTCAGAENSATATVKVTMQLKTPQQATASKTSSSGEIQPGKTSGAAKVPAVPASADGGSGGGGSFGVLSLFCFLIGGFMRARAPRRQ